MTVKDLSVFITEQVYKEKSRSRRISHVKAPMENFVDAMRVYVYKLKAITMLIFKALGLGHLEEEFVV